MKRQASFKNKSATLFLVATPIGNLNEFSSRAVEVLKNVDVIACEDTRTSKTLLKHFGIDNKLISYHNFNEKASTEGILSLLAQSKNIALISDAGYPIISDPGYELVNNCIKHEYNVVPISGANAALNALVASGLSGSHFLFYGFLNNKSGEAHKELEALKKYPFTIIFYEAPHRINKTLNLIYQIFGNRYCCLAREITKQYEEFIRGNLDEIKDLENLKGEMVIVLDGYKNDDKDICYDDLIEIVHEYIKLGMSTKDAIAVVAKEHGVSKKDVYNRYHQA